MMNMRQFSLKSGQPVKKRGRPSKRKQAANNGPRTFNLPKPNYDAVSYANMIIWEDAQKTEPPLLKDYDDERLQQLQKSPLQLDISSNTQFVERQIRVVTQKGTLAADPKVRDGLAKATLGSYKKMPRYKSKADFRAFSSP